MMMNIYYDMHVPITLTSCVSNALAIFNRQVSTMDTSLLPSCPSVLIILNNVNVFVVIVDVVANGDDTDGVSVPRDILFMTADVAK